MQCNALKHPHLPQTEQNHKILNQQGAWIWQHLVNADAQFLPQQTSPPWSLKHHCVRHNGFWACFSFHKQSLYQIKIDQRKNFEEFELKVTVATLWNVLDKDKTNFVFLLISYRTFYVYFFLLNKSFYFLFFKLQFSSNKQTAYLALTFKRNRSKSKMGQ